MAPNLRSLWARTNNPLGAKINDPDAWITENGPVWWWGSDSAFAYGPQNPSGYAAITRATSIIVNRLASSDWSVGDETPRWISDPMLCRPDERYGISARPHFLRLPGPYFWGQYIRSALLHGMGYLAYAEGADGLPWPGSMHLLNPMYVDVAIGPDGLRRMVINNTVEVEDDGSFVLNSKRWRLLILRNPTTPIDPETGLSIGTLAHHMVELGMVASIAHYASGTYNGSGVPSGYLKVNTPQMTQPQADQLKADWQAAHGGGKRSTAVLTATVDYTPIAVSPVDAALADMKRLSLVDVANAFCVPLFMLGAPPGHSNVYSNVATEQQALWTHTLQPWAKCIESTIGALLPAGTDLVIELPSLTIMNTPAETQRAQPTPLDQQQPDTTANKGTSEGGAL